MLEHMFDHPAHGMANPPLPWSELERRLAGRPPPANQPPEADGGDAPAWSSSAIPTSRPQRPRSGATRVGGGGWPFPMPSCTAIPMRVFWMGVPSRSWRRRRRVSAWRRWPSPTTTACTGSSASPKRPGPLLPTIFGAELTLTPAGARAASGARTGTPDPAGEHLVVLARGPEGYARLSRAISEAQMAGAKGRPGELGRLAGLHGGHWVVLTGCRKGRCRAPCTGGARRPPRPSWTGWSRRSGGATSTWSSGTTATARLGPQRRPGPAGRPGEGRGGGDQQRPLRRPVPPPPGHRPGRGRGPQLPGRPGRLAARRGRRPSPLGFEQAAAWPATRARSNWPPSSAATWPSTWSWSRPACPTSRSRRATPR